MADPKQQIELECQQVQEHLLKLTADRNALHQEFQQLTKSSHRLLQQIQEDSTSASERKFHNYEAEKKRIAEKLEALESGILEKDRNIALLDAKAGDYLLQVSTTSNSLFDDDKAEKPFVSGCGGGGDAVAVGEGNISIEGAKFGSNEVEVKCSDKCNEISQVKVDGSANKKEDKSEREMEDVNVLCGSGEAYVIKMADTIISEALDEAAREERPRESDSAINTVNVPISEPKKSEDVVKVIKVEAEKASGISDDEVKQEMLKEKEVYHKKIDSVNVESKIEIKKCVTENSEGLVDNVLPAEIVETKKSEIAENDNVKNKDKNLEEVNRSDRDVIPGAVMTAKDVSEVPHAVAPTPSVTPSTSLLDSDAALPTVTQSTSGSSPKDIPGKDNAGKQTQGNGSPVRDQVASLSVLVAELRRVKDDMGKCMSVKEQSFIELEDQLQAANKEVASLKVSMSSLAKDLEENKQNYQVLEEENKKKKMDIEFKMSEVQDVTNKCTMLAEEKSDLLRKLEVLDIMMTEYRTEIEMLVAEKTKMEEQTKELLAAKTTTSAAEAEIDSRTNVEEKEKEIEELVEKVQSMEKEMKELNDKLKVTNRHLKVMAREREHKQKECEVLKRKVEMVELKMCELQGTFDMLVKAVMVERDDLIKEMEEKNSQIDDLQQTLVRLKDTHEQELENVLYDKKIINDELLQYKSGELRSTKVPVVDKKEFDAVIQKKETLEEEVRQKTEETIFLNKKVQSIQDDMTDFVDSLKDEMARLKEDGEKMKSEKDKLMETFATLQTEYLDLTNKHQHMESSYQELEISNREKTASLEALKLQLEDLQHQLEDLNAKNFNMTTEMYNKEEEFREELAAREGTIQELTVTLTNNQKQSMENYIALEEDKASLETKYKTILTENERQRKDFEEKFKLSEEEKSREVKELQEKINSLMENLKEIKTEVTESQASARLQDKYSTSASLPFDSSTTSHSLVTDAECGEVVDKENLIEILTKRGKDLKDALEVTQKKLDAKEAETKNLIDSDIPRMQGQINELTSELETLKAKSTASGTFKSHEEFESIIAAKEEKIRELEAKVGELDKCMAYITQLEGKLQGTPDASNNIDSQLVQINQLSADISKLEGELKQSCGECEALKTTITQLENEKLNFEREKSKLVEEYESKLQQVNGSLEEANAELEKKKKLG